MEAKTQIRAEAGQQELHITREFDLPVGLLFKAYTTPGIVEEWMGTKVLKLDNAPHGSYRFETTDPKGNKHGFNGTIHEFVTDSKITRTFEMENTGFPVQLEYLDFEPLEEERSRLRMQIVYRSVAWRDKMLQLPFAQGLNWAHNRLEDALKKQRHGQ